jgi:hypothetical protein
MSECPSRTRRRRVAIEIDQSANRCLKPIDPIQFIAECIQDSSLA